ncbi:hypothetical protein IPM19_01830 [bacterium]|nr:MAG: hypothetical protein IPM19_01830 [bacterium]
MKKITIAFVVVALFVCVASVRSQEAPKNSFHGYVEPEVDSTGTARVKAFVTYGGKTKLGAYCWGQTSEGYSQVYCGPTYSFSKGVQVGVAVGAETVKNSLRKAGFIWTGKGRFANLLVVESGGSGHWYRNQASYQASKAVSLSITSQRFSGTGPRVDVTLPKTSLSVGGEYHFATQTSRFGVRYSF